MPVSVRTVHCGLLSIIVTLFASTALFSSDISGTANASSDSPSQSLLNVGRFTSWIRSDGFAGLDIDGLWNETFPKGTARVVRSTERVWGGFVHDCASPALPYRWGGMTTMPGLAAGRIIVDAGGTVLRREDPTSNRVRVHRVRPDWESADLRDDALQLYQSWPTDDAMIRAVRDQYRKDWLEWPADRGAPFVGRNENGFYEPAIDVPGILGADQTIWLVANDLDPVRAALYGSPPIGSEPQITPRSDDRAAALRDAIVKRTRLIDRGTTRLHFPSTG